MLQSYSVSSIDVPCCVSTIANMIGFIIMIVLKITITIIIININVNVSAYQTPTKPASNCSGARKQTDSHINRQSKRNTKCWMHEDCGNAMKSEHPDPTVVQGRAANTRMPVRGPAWKTLPLNIVLTALKFRIRGRVKGFAKPDTDQASKQSVRAHANKPIRILIDNRQTSTN